ncbi:MAG: IS1595 family transposase, partial [Bacteroidetes bacterium]
MEKRIIFEGVNSIKFNQFFKTDDDCIKYISE